MGGMVKGKSDPYVKINIGGETFVSRVIKSNLNPVWNEMYEVNNTRSCIESKQFNKLDCRGFVNCFPSFQICNISSPLR